MMNEKMFALAKRAENAAKDLRNGKYSNGQYSTFSGDCARRAFTEIQEELEKLAKEMLKAEVLAEASRPAIPALNQPEIPKGYEEMFTAIQKELDYCGRWCQCMQTDDNAAYRLLHLMRCFFVPLGYTVNQRRNCSWVYFTVEKNY